MSKYADKHAYQPPCAATPCTAVARKLLLISGTPWWLCDSCYDRLSTGETHGRTG